MNNFLETSKAWRAVFEVLQYIQRELKLEELPFNEIFVNFRDWQSQHPWSRHAHINVKLTKQAIDACQK